MPSDPKPPAPNSVHGFGGCAILLFTLFWSSVTLVGDFMLIRDVVRQCRALGYVTAEGTMVKCQVTEDADDEGVSYGIDAEYAYRVNGQPFTASRVRHLTLWGRTSAARFAADHPPGSAVTVYYDPADPAEAILLPGLGGPELFQPLFLLPFNIVMLTLGFGVGRALLFGEPAAADWPKGVHFFERDDEARVRLNKTTPATAGLAVLGAGGFFGTFVVAFGAGMPPPTPFMIGLWAVVLGWAAFAYWRMSRRISAGKNDLVIDRFGRTLTLPQTFGRTEPVVISFADVRSVEVVVVETKDEDGHQVRYAPTVRWGDADEMKDGKLAEWADRDQAERLVAWITSRCT